MPEPRATGAGDPTEPRPVGAAVPPGLAAGDAGAPTAQGRVLAWVLALNAALMVAEVVGGLVFGSLALLADGAHMLSDVVGLAIALVAQRLARRAPSIRHSYGLARADVLAAQTNAVILLLTAAWILYEGVGRLGSPPELEAGGVLVVASLGLAVNLGSALLLARRRHENLNLRGAFIHMAADTAGSVGVIVAAVLALALGVYWVDPVAALAVGALVVWSAGRLLMQSTHILMEGTPRHLDPKAVATTIQGVGGVDGVHHLHLWSLDSHTTALSAHVTATGRCSLAEAQGLGKRIREVLAEQFAITHATLELEDESCE